MNRIVTALFISIFFISSCNSNEIGNGKDVDPESIFMDYKIWGMEGDSDITIMLQYRFAGPNGTTLLLDEPSKVELDGRELKVDSSKITGAFYELIVPVNEFTGNHTIVYTDINKKQYKESFNFSPITLDVEIPSEIGRENLLLQINGLESEDQVRILMLDTSSNDGINRLDSVRNGRVLITKEDLDLLTNGPIYLELYKEVDRPVKEGTGEGGKLAITYGLKREFILKD